MVLMTHPFIITTISNTELSTGSTTAPTPKYSKTSNSGSSGAYTEVYFYHSNTTFMNINALPIRMGQTLLLIMMVI